MSEIRPVRLGDETKLFELVRAFPTPTPPDGDVFASALRTKLADRSSFVAVAEKNGSLVGYVAGYAHVTFYAGGSTAWVDELLVDGPYRGQGVGRRLIDAFETWALGLDCKLIALATSGAGPFYAALGYSTKAEYYKKYLAAPGRRGAE